MSKLFTLPLHGFLRHTLVLDDRRLSLPVDRELSEYRDNENERWSVGRSNTGLFYAIWWEWPSYSTKAAKSSYIIQGQTQDGGGGPLGNVTVRAYLTADDTLQGQCVSNAGGWYYIGVPTNAAHYLIMTKAGSPNRGGMSPNNVIPT